MLVRVGTVNFVEQHGTRNTQAHQIKRTKQEQTNWDGTRNCTERLRISKRTAVQFVDASSGTLEIPTQTPVGTTNMVDHLYQEGCCVTVVT
jgi:hypothetical protein